MFPGGAQRGTTVEVTAGGTFERWPIQIRTSNAGIKAKPSKEKGKLTVTVAADVEPGRHWLWLYDAQGASIQQPFLVGALPEVREREPNDEPRTAQSLPFAAATVNGRFDKPGDVDCYALTLQKGQTLVAAFDGWNSLRSPMDAVLQILSPDGFVLEQNNDFHGLDPFTAFPVKADGQYIVRTFCFPAVPDSSIRFAGGEAYVYRLTLTTGGFVDHAYPLSVERKKPGMVEAVGWNVSPTARRLPIAATVTANRVFIRHPAFANSFEVGVEPHPCLAKPDNGADPFPLDPPATVTGRLSRPRAVDQFMLKAKKSQTLVIRAESQELGLPVSAVIRIADAAGHDLAKAEPAGLHSDTELAFVPPADGDFRLTVTDIYAAGGPRYVYRLRVAAPQPDFALSLAADRFTLAAGQSLDVPIAVQRLHGFAGEINLTVEDLPPGVEAKVDAGKDPAKMTLKLTAQPDSTGAGPFRITGRTKTGVIERRVASAVVPAPFDGAPAVRTEMPWLTVIHPPPAKPAGKP